MSIQDEPNNNLDYEGADDIQTDGDDFGQTADQPSAPDGLEFDFREDPRLLESAIEALLFISPEPINLLTFTDILALDALVVDSALRRLQQRYEQDDRGIQLVEIAGGWRLVSHPRYHELLERLVVSWDRRRLTKAALETLAIVAYCQPITRNEISSIRGVSSDSSVNSLLDKGLIREAGELPCPHSAIVYATSKEFLEKFGLNSVEELPPLESFEPSGELKDLISQRLGLIREKTEGRDLEERQQPIEGGVAENSPQTSFVQGRLSDALGDEFTNGSLRDDVLSEMAGVVDEIDFDQIIFDEDE